jgi:hypothetical protein
MIADLPCSWVVVVFLELLSDGLCCLFSAIAVNVCNPLLQMESFIMQGVAIKIQDCVHSTGEACSSEE